MITLFGASVDDQESDIGSWLFDVLGDFWSDDEATSPATAIEVDDFQLKILQFLVTILIINIVGIYFAWRVYGPTISERLMRPISAKVFEELKSGAKELKLPAEHSPRI
ncbi:hypothetical protein CHUAL_007085 [Chamberlinius hualienensis]